MLLSSVFLRFFCKFSMKIIFYLPVNTNNPKFVAFLVFVCMTASFLSQISPSENVLKQDAILSPVAKQWIAKDIPSYGSQWKRAKIAIHWFGKYYILITGKLQETTGWREACQLYCKIAFAVSSSETTTSCSQLKRHRSLRPIPQRVARRQRLARDTCRPLRVGRRNGWHFRLLPAGVELKTLLILLNLEYHRWQISALIYNFTGEITKSPWQRFVPQCQDGL